MTCKQIEAEGVIEQYLANLLPNAARKAFELHYFGCDQCFETLEAYRATVTALRQTPKAPRRWIWPAAVAAAAALAVLGVRFFPHPTKIQMPSAPDVALLARVEPPPYSVPVLRGVPDGATTEFHSAMEPYRQGDYAAASEALKKFLDGSPKQGRPFIDAEFFLGACYLLTGRTDDASVAFQAVLVADSPYLEEAHFLMAETWLKKREAGHARAELEKVIAMNGDLRNASEILLAKLK
jgi:TolA-binding protein